MPADSNAPLWRPPRSVGRSRTGPHRAAGGRSAATRIARPEIQLLWSSEIDVTSRQSTSPWNIPTRTNEGGRVSARRRDSNRESRPWSNRAPPPNGGAAPAGAVARALAVVGRRVLRRQRMARDRPSRRVYCA